MEVARTIGDLALAASMMLPPNGGWVEPPPTVDPIAPVGIIEGEQEAVEECVGPLIEINGGAEFTNKAQVTLTFCPENESEVSEMIIGNDGGLGDPPVWEPYSREKDWEITLYKNLKLQRWVYVIFLYANGEKTPIYPYSIVFDPDYVGDYRAYLPSIRKE